ncbi:MAG: alpha/beta hydrolase [Bacteroidota bacterium]|nr:alpha/beta hydrolase [Bacteroidota bacterium]
MKHVRFKNKKIFYKVEGKGNPVMFLHGFAEDGRVWNYQVENLKRNYRLIIPDLPGSGPSEMLEGEVMLSDYAEAIKAIVDEEIDLDKEDQFTMIGHSMGGYITLAFAEKYPAALNGIGLFHSSSFADDEQKKETRRKGIGFIKKNGPELFLKNTIPNLFSEKTKAKAPELVEKLIALSKNFSGEALIQYYEAMIKRPDHSAILRSFKEPVLIIAGMHDNAVPLQASLSQSYIAAITYLHILKLSGHMGMWEQEAHSTRHIQSFLSGLQVKHRVDI